MATANETTANETVVSEESKFLSSFEFFIIDGIKYAINNYRKTEVINSENEFLDKALELVDTIRVNGVQNTIKYILITINGEQVRYIVDGNHRTMIVFYLHLKGEKVLFPVQELETPALFTKDLAYLTYPELETLKKGMSLFNVAIVETTKDRSLQAKELYNNLISYYKKQPNTDMRDAQKTALKTVKERYSVSSKTINFWLSIKKETNLFLESVGLSLSDVNDKVKKVLNDDSVREAINTDYLKSTLEATGDVEQVKGALLLMLKKLQENENGNEGTTNEGTTNEGTTNEGTTNEGTTNEGTTNEGTTNEGTTNEGTTNEGTTNEGTTNEGTTNEGTTNEGTTNEGTTNDSLLSMILDINESDTKVVIFEKLSKIVSHLTNN